MKTDIIWNTQTCVCYSKLFVCLSVQCVGEENWVDSRTVYIGQKEPPPGTEAFIQQRFPDNRITSSKVSENTHTYTQTSKHTLLRTLFNKARFMSVLSWVSCSFETVLKRLHSGIICKACILTKKVFEMCLHHFLSIHVVYKKLRKCMYIYRNFNNAYTHFGKVNWWRGWWGGD